MSMPVNDQDVFLSGDKKKKLIFLFHKNIYVISLYYLTPDEYFLEFLRI